MEETEFDLHAAVNHAAAYAEATGTGCAILDGRGLVRYPAADEYPCRLCRFLSSEEVTGQANAQSHWVWVEQAARLGGRFISMCPNSFTHWTSPIITEGRVTGAFVAGPVLTTDDADFFDEELIPDNISEGRRESLRRLFDDVPKVSPSRVAALATILAGIARSVSDSTDRVLDEAAAVLERQSPIGEYVHDLKTYRLAAGGDPEVPTYPVDIERFLLDQIRLGNTARAQETLNELLGHVFFASGSDIASIRVRTRELVVLLSRAVIAEGADPEEVFGLNYRFVDALDQQSDINAIAFWMARIVRRFADLVLYMPNVAHGMVMRKAVAYVRAHMAEPIRVKNVAAHVGLSPTYFSRVFAEEMDVPFVSYVNRVRIDKARDLLRATTDPVTAIAAEVGIGDHSYFTKLFRRETGVTPSAYRSSAR